MNKENKLIAEFMGWECRTRKSYEDNIKVLYKPDGSIFKYSGFGYLRNKTPWDAPFQFHNSWDWLMPVVEKIESLGYFTKIYSYATGAEIESCMDIMSYNKDENYKSLYLFGKFTYDESKIIAIFNSVVEFIKWYNKKQKNDRN